MLRSFYTSVSSLITMENKQNVITNNMANANTNGFKSESLITKGFDEVLLATRENDVFNELGTLSLGVNIDEINTKFTQGLIKETSRPTDFAIDGRGFFVVQRNVGGQYENVYTRDGNFKISIDGTLMTTTGDKVLGTNLQTGAVEPIFVGDSEFVLDNNNVIQVEGFANYELATVDFEDYNALTKIGDNYYKGENPMMNTNIWVNQGYIEGSNVDLGTEMINMMTTMREFETNQKMVQIIDETMEKAATEIGRI